MLSPFSGTARIILQHSIRAISTDGVNWRIQVQTASSTSNAANRYTLFGLWTLAGGIKTFPLHPQHVSPNLQQRAHDFVEQLPEWLDSRDFPLLDNMECWLLDQEQQPLALLISSLPNQALADVRQSTWLPCALNDHTFVSAHIQHEPQQHTCSATPNYHRDLVAQRVHLAAGQDRQIQWFQRQADGSGVSQHIQASQQTYHLPAEAFPHFLLRQHWEMEKEQLLFDDFFHWQSPWLLTLPGLSEDERCVLEVQACTYPQRLHALYRLYPVLLQKELIHTTLVQAKIEKTVLPTNS